jgi:oligosaccharide repeat unit polymerase
MNNSILIIVMTAGLMAIPVISIALSWRQIPLLAPTVFPFILFSLIYYYPALARAAAGTDTQASVFHWLFLLGSLSYLAGILLATRYIHLRAPHTLKKVFDIRPVSWIRNKELNRRPASWIPWIPWIPWLLGIALLVFYGVWSGVLPALLRGENVEQLRRSAEIGKGFIKTPAVLLSSLSILWLLARRLHQQPASTWWRLLLLAAATLFTSCLIFFCVGNKVPALLPLFVLVALYTRRWRFGVLKLVAVVVIAILLIGVLNYTRRGDSESSFADALATNPLPTLTLYHRNYSPVVKAVETGLLPLQYGREYSDSFLAIVPRFLYENKPVSFDYFLKDLLGYKFEGGGLPPTFFGSLFLNFGILGVIFGGILLGSVYTLAYRRYVRAGPEMAVILVFAMYYLMNPSQLLSSILFLAIFGALLFFCVDVLSRAVSRFQRASTEP